MSDDGDGQGVQRSRRPLSGAAAAAAEALEAAEPVVPPIPAARPYNAADKTTVVAKRNRRIERRVANWILHETALIPPEEPARTDTDPLSSDGMSLAAALLMRNAFGGTTRRQVGPGDVIRIPKLAAAAAPAPVIAAPADSPAERKRREADRRQREAEEFLKDHGSKEYTDTLRREWESTAPRLSAEDRARAGNIAMSMRTLALGNSTRAGDLLGVTRQTEAKHVARAGQFPFLGVLPVKRSVDQKHGEKYMSELRQDAKDYWYSVGQRSAYNSVTVREEITPEEDTARRAAAGLKRIQLRAQRKLQAADAAAAGGGDGAAVAAAPGKKPKRIFRAPHKMPIFWMVCGVYFLKPLSVHPHTHTHT